MQHLLNFRADIAAALPGAAAKFDPELTEALRRAAQYGDDVRLVRVVNIVNRRFISDLMVRFIASVVDGFIRDTAHHDFVMRTARGGHIYIEVKAAAMRRGKGKMTNARGEAMRVNLVALIADPNSPCGLEILILPAGEIRRDSYETADGGWGISLSDKRLGAYRETGALLPFDEGIEAIISLATAGRD